MTLPTVAIAGSGLGGLACADALAGRADCLLLERLPVLGGEHWRDPAVARLAARVRRQQARLLLGSLAIRWDGQQVLSIGHQGARLDPADALVVATGHRPLSRAELGIEGPRCGGVLPVTVALHLLRAGVRLGRRPLVVGATGWAAAAVAELLRQPVEEVIVLASGRLDLPRRPGRPPVRLHAGAGAVALRGDPRVEAVQAWLPDGRLASLACDAVILAAGRVPMRNIDGAVCDGAGVAFAQGGDEHGQEAAGRAAAEEALRLAATPRPPRPPALRIGGEP